MMNEDRIVDLRKRLDELPSELDDLFWKILESTDPFYKEHACELFQIYRVHNLMGPLFLLRLAFADEESDEILREVRPTLLTDNEIRCLLQTMKVRLDNNQRVIGSS